MDAPRLKSSPNNRLEAIFQALQDAHLDAAEQSQTSLNRMPEYFMAVRVADHFARHFRNFGYRLEPQVKQTFEDSDLWHSASEELGKDPDLRPDGRFDLVLRTGKRNRPAHVLEFKRGGKLEALSHDLRRLAAVCRHAGTERLKTNYLVFTRKCRGTAAGDEQDIERLRSTLADLEGIQGSVHASDPLTPFINRHQERVSGAAFRVIVVELKAI
ncbi:hypothetical protein ACGTN6_04275 [Halomonas sp. THAF12]|uniref:hypothetical protein n=1 Tax=Halomonas sp. B23F22_10 TaxID=3459515 RepID=UPI00373FA80C